MATQKVSAEVDVALKASNADSVQKTLDAVVKAVEGLPTSAKNASKELKDLFVQVTNLQGALKNAGSLNGISNEVKSIAATLKSIKTIRGLQELFSNKDIQNINAAQRAITQYAKAYELTQRAQKIKDGTFGLDQTKISEVVKSIQSLRTELNAIQQSINSTNGGRFKANDPLTQDALALRKNIKLLEEHRGQLQRTMDMRKEELEYIKQASVQNAQFQARQSGAVRGADVRQTFDRSSTGQAAGVSKANVQNASDARYANPQFEAYKIVQQELAALNAINAATMTRLGLQRSGLGLSSAALPIHIAIVAKEAEYKEEILKGNLYTQKALSLNKELQGLKANLALQKSKETRDNGPLQEAQEAQRVNAMLARTQGAGGAALLKVQLALMANYAIINTVSGSVRQAVTNSVELEQALANVRAVTNTTATEMVGLSEVIKNVASNSRFSAVETANAALILGQAGLSSKLIAESLPSVITLATAAGTSLANAVDLVTSIVGVFDKQASDTADVANKITAASNSSKVSVEKLGLAFQYVGNTAAQTGVSFEETTAALAAMSNAGITSGSTLGTGLRHFLTEVQKPSEEFLNALRRIGLGVSDIDIRSKGLIGVITTLRQAGFVASDAIKSFDIRSASAFNGLIANPQALQDQFEKLQGTTAAVEAARIQMDTFDSQAKRLTTSFNVLAASGFEPIQKLATMIASALGSLFQVLSEYPNLVQAVTTAAIALVAVQLGAHFSGIAAAFFSASGSAGVVATSLRALTTVTIAQATASTVLSGSLVRLGATIVGIGTILAASGGLMGAFTKAMIMARVAVLTLVESIGLLSIATGIGLVIAAVATALYFFESSTEKAAKASDTLRAKVEESKGGFDEASKTVDSLGKKIADLEYRQNSLQGNTGELTRVGKELESQFGKIGYQTDATNNSFSNMIGKLRTLKGEMQLMANAKLTAQIKSQQELVGAQVNQLNESTGNLTGSRGQGPSARIQAAVTGLDQKNLSAGERQLITDTVNTVSRLKEPGFVSSEKGVSALLTASRGLEVISNNLKGDAKLGFSKDMTGVQDVIAKALTVASSRSELRSQQNVQAQVLSAQAFSQAKLFNGKTFEEALPKFSDIPGAIKEANKGASEKTLYDKSAEKFQAAVEQIEGLRSQVRSNSGLSVDQKSSAIEQLNNQESLFAQAGKRYYDTVKSRYELDTKKENDLLSLKKVELLRKGDNLGAADLDRIIAANKSKLKTNGVFGKNDRAEAAAAAELLLGDQRALNTEQKPGRKSSREPKDELEALKASTDAYAVRAKSIRQSAMSSNSLDEVDNLLDGAIDQLMKSKAKELELLVAKQNREIAPGARNADQTENFAGALRDQKEKGEEEVKMFAEQAGKIYGAVRKRLDKTGVRADADAIAARLKKAQEDSNDALYDASRGLSQMAIETAQGNRVSGNPDEKLAQLNLTLTKINGLVNELSIYADAVTLLQQQVAIDKAEVDRLTAITEDRNVTPAQRAGAQSSLEVALDIQKRNVGELDKNKSGQDTTRSNLDAAKLEAIGQGKGIPADVSWENMKTKLNEVKNSYASFVKNFDIIGSVGDGIEGTLKGLTGNFADLFTNIASGSMSASDAFKQFAAGIIKQMLSIIAQALAMAAIQAILKGMGFATGGVVTKTSGSVTNDAGISLGGTRKAATGGVLSGGTPGVDSIPVMAMAGEYIMQKKAVDAVGLDFMHGLNNSTNASVNSVSTSSAASMPTQKAPETHNIWIVTPDQKPSMGPRDVVIAVQDSLNQSNSPIKTLVKQIAAGTA